MPARALARLPSPAQRPRGIRFTSCLAAAGLLGIFALGVLGAARSKSATFDEPGHAAAGYSYWQTGDYRLDPENGILPQRWFGLALHTIPHAFPGAADEAWRAADLWTLADRWLNRMGNDAPAIVARGRLAASGFAVALGALVWAWSRRRFGPTGGLVSLGLYVLSPTLLAHGALMTSDVAAAFFFTAFLWCFERMLERMSVGRMLLSAATLGCLFVTKASAVLALPVATVILAVHLWRHRASRAVAPVAGALAVHAAIVPLIIWAAYGFRFAANPTGDPAQSRFQAPWASVLDETAPGGASARPLPVAAIAFAREHRLLPEAFLYGYAHVWKFSRGRGTFFRGEITDSGRLAFFPYTFAVKTPLAAFGIFALAAAAWIARRRAGDAPPPASPPDAMLPLVVLVLVYGTAALMSDLNLGVRHLMPVFPALFILSGAAGHWVDSAPATTRARGARIALFALGAALLIEVAWWFPNYLAYFNGLVAPRRAYRHLVDSSLDWGQDLPALARALERRPRHEAQFLAYFGTASPLGHGIRARQIYSYPLGDRAESPPFKIIDGPQDDRSLVAALERLPDYDPRLVYPIEVNGRPASHVVKRASALQLAAGRYWISASLLQPVYYPRAHGHWTPQHEAAYQDLRAAVAPFLAEDRATRVAALRRFPPARWNSLLGDFEEFRFARLTAWLRRREPDDHVNYSILAYDLSAEDLDRALHGHSP